MNDTIHRIHKAEKELHQVHRLCLKAETLYREAQNTPSFDLSFFVPVDISQEIKSKKRIAIPEEYLPPCEYALMCILQKEAQESHRSFDMPMWNNYDEEIVKKILKNYEGEKELMEAVKEQEVAKRMRMSDRLSKLYPHIHYLAGLIARVKFLEEQKDSVFAAMNKMIYGTSRIRLNVEQLKKQMIIARDIPVYFGLEKEIKERFEFLKRRVTN